MYRCCCRRTAIRRIGEAERLHRKSVRMLRAHVMEFGVGRDIIMNGGNYTMTRK